MSRRLPSSQRRLPPPTDSSHYQAALAAQRAYPHQNPKLGHHHQDYQQRCRGPYRNGVLKPATTIDIGFSDETTDTQSYDYYYQENGFQHSPLRESRNTDVTFSDDSGSTRLPYYEFDDESNKRYSRNTFSERSSTRPKMGPDKKVRGQIVMSKDPRKVYPNQEGQWDQLYHEIQTPCDNVPASSAPRRIPTRLSHRSHSTMSSGVTSAIVHGCGGKCQTFENVCYFFLQLVFTMGILIGVSLCIAGIVLRKSAARNLQVLVYIGVLLALVSALLLGIQCNARNTARKRKKAILMAKRAPIQMDTLHLRQNPLHQQPLMVAKMGPSQRPVQQVPQVHGSLSRPPPPRQHNLEAPPMVEEQGIPWWRRKDLNTQ
ncbi:uncharacterized protein LOC108912757 [Anoplophora glabripennis]|uniref:uncharacterized protein LOC108912757 n=1 Tax=Anoplophora glabripennis TaxID=217634 RepID=UPI000875A586|nr:uncharacterized protein LOC108912757 [Anoplophora glabripennis]